MEADGVPQVEVAGEFHPSTLAARSLRIGIEVACNQNADQVPALRQIIERLTKAEGLHSLSKIRTRYRLARTLWLCGEIDSARAEIDDVIDSFDSFDPATSPEHELLRAAVALGALIQGRSTGEHLIV
jgi:hypothetical protein